MRYLIISPRIIETTVCDTRSEVDDQLQSWCKAEQSLQPAGVEYYLNLAWDQAFDVKGVRYWIVEDGYKPPQMDGFIIVVVEVP